MRIPDLRPGGDGITLEHCSVLLEGMNAALGVMYEGGAEEFQVICSSINPETMRDDLLTMFTSPAFDRLFKSQMGKGIMIGAFLQRIMTEMEVE